MGGGGNRKGPQADINVTPLVDIVLVLLIIFMVITPMLERGAEVKLPPAEHAENKENAEDDTIVSVRPDGALWFNEEAVSEEILREKLATLLAEDATKPLLIKADVTTKYVHVRKVMTLCEELGAKSVGLMTDKNQLPKKKEG